MEQHLQKSLGDVTKHFLQSFNILLAHDVIVVETLEVLQKHKIFIKYPQTWMIEGKSLQQVKLDDAFPQQRDLDKMNI